MKSLFMGFLAIALLAGCATTTRTETRKILTETRTVVAGDTVQATTKDGRKLEFTVTRADNQQIEGKGIVLQRADLVSLKAVTTSTVTTTETSAKPAVQVISAAAVVWGIVCVVAILAVF